ncbi:MAG: glycoside hydrolase family 78 protein [Clostridia bacterium]|nr:glycoside hydrolase family 78 protein [Clostridia bacterium]
MMLSDRFICAGEEYATYEKSVPAPYFRKTFSLDELPGKAELTVCGLGFYRLWVNGKEITKGLFAPYITNPDEIVFYDGYDLAGALRKGKNVLVFLLGNGMLDAPGGSVWDFDKDSFRASPRLAFALELDGETVEAGPDVKTHPSPIYFNDLRAGERYDAKNEISGVLDPEFDDSAWTCAVGTSSPKGEKRLCGTDPVKKTGTELAPVSVVPGERSLEYHPHGLAEGFDLFEKYTDTKGYIYDFGVNTAGVFRLRIKGEPGQRIELQFAETLDGDGKLYYGNIQFYPDGFSQHDVYILSGNGEEVWEPSFVYHGARYCLVTGIKPEQATKELLTFLPAHSAFDSVGSFECSDPVANKLYAMTRVSDLANFFYFPTDCPHREKNGWTGDAAMSAEHFFMNYDCLKSLSVWLETVREAQGEDGSIPCMVPTGSWGRRSGPSWDAALTYIPYYAYRFTGDRRILEDNACAIARYLEFISGKRTPAGTVDLFLGDWVPVGGVRRASTEFTDTMSFLSICGKAEFIFDVLGQTERRARAHELYVATRDAVRKHLVNFHTMLADTACQTSQAMALYHGIFNADEKERAFAALVELIHRNGDFFDCGMLGVRYLFHVLADGGEIDLAYKLITRPEWPSYGHFIEQGLTAIPEDFWKDGGHFNSLNHHFLGDISNFFISKIAGLVFNPTGRDVHEYAVRPNLPAGMDCAEASYNAPDGLIKVRVRRNGDSVGVDVSAPECMKRI